MLKPGGSGLDDINGIGEQGKVRSILPGPCWAIGVAGEEDMGDMPKMTELGPTVRGIAEVDGNEFRLRIIVGLATGQPDDLPIIFLLIRDTPPVGMYVLNMFCMRGSRLWGSRLHRACVV